MSIFYIIQRKVNYIHIHMLIKELITHHAFFAVHGRQHSMVNKSIPLESVQV